MSVQGFIFSRAVYPEKDARPIIAQVQFKQLLLDNCATVDDVIDICDTIRIQSPTNRFGQHYLACDSSGACIAIDFVEGNTIFHTGENLPVTAYVDTAMYNECIDYLNRHEGFGGSKPVGGSNNALDRFVPASIGLKTKNLTIQDAFRILENVEIEGYTQWQIVYDSNTHTLYYRTRLNSQLRKLDVSRLDYSCEKPTLGADMEAVDRGSISALLKPYASEKHLLYLKELNRFYRLSEDMVENISKYPKSFICNQNHTK